MRSRKAQSVVAAEYRGLTVTQMTELRSARPANRRVHASRQEHAGSRAVEGTDFECVNDTLTGPLLFAFSQEDPGAAARLIKEFAKDNDKLVRRWCRWAARSCRARDLERVAPADARPGAGHAARRPARPRSASSFARWPSLTRSSCARSPRCKTRRARPPERRLRQSIRVFKQQFSGGNANGPYARKRSSTPSASMTLMEVVDLVKAMEEKFGVTAAAPVAMAAGRRRCRCCPGRKSRPSSP